MRIARSGGYSICPRGIGPFSASFLLAVSSAYALDPASPFGVVAFVPSQTRWDYIQSARIAWARCDFSWRSVETSQDVFNWALTDQMVADANARGINIYAGLGYTPSWASSGGQSQNPPISSADWADYVSHVVNRYKGSIHHWEMWNEPNLSQFWSGTRQQYIDLILKPGADAVHAADPTAKVVSPEISTCTASGCQATTWMNDVLSQAGSKVDIICHHQYDGSNTVSGRLSAIDSMHNTIVAAGYGSKDLWITESGWRSDGSGNTEQSQASNLAGMLAGMQTRPWWKKFFWFQIWEGGAGTEKWGLLYQNETPKPSWFSYRDFAYASAWGPQTPFFGAPANVPGTVQAEDFDNGGEGVAYHDIDTSNNGGQYRSTGVDVEGTSDTGSGFNVGFINTGEWLKYSLNVTSAGTYDVSLRVASCCSGGSYHIELQGINVSGTKSIPLTGGWQTWSTVTVSGITFNSGPQVLKVVVDSGGTWNLNWIGVGVTQGPFGGSPRAIPGSIQAEDFDTGGQNVAYFDTDAGNNGGAYRTGDVDIEATSDTGGGYNVGWTTPNEWLEYTVNVANTGDHTFKLRVASCCGDGIVHLEINGTNLTGSKTFGSTGGWQNWTTLLLPARFLTAGNNQVLRFYMENGNLNINKIDVSYDGADAVHVDLASTDYQDGMSHPVCCDGNTTGALIAGHYCRQNINPNADYYMYFNVAEAYAYQGSRPNLWVTVEYFDLGSGSLTLQYDATSTAYKSGPSVTLTNTNTWKSVSWNVTDAYFGNRENGGADFRVFRGTGQTFYLDTVQVSLAQP